MAIKFDASPRPPEGPSKFSGWQVRFGAWLRDLIAPESPAVRRQRLEAEAAAELRLRTGEEQPAH